MTGPARGDGKQLSGEGGKQWVESHFPSATGSTKAGLILAYEAGLDAGLKKAQTLIGHVVMMRGLDP